MVHLANFFGYFFTGSSNSNYNQDKEQTIPMKFENYDYFGLPMGSCNSPTTFLKLFRNSVSAIAYIDDQLVIPNQSKQQKKLNCNQAGTTQRQLVRFWNTCCFLSFLSIFVQSFVQYHKTSTHRCQRTKKWAKKFRAKIDGFIPHTL